MLSGDLARLGTKNVSAVSEARRWKSPRSSAGTPTGALSIQPFERSPLGLAGAIAYWVLNPNRVPCWGDEVVGQLTFDMAIALPNGITRSVCRASGFVVLGIAQQLGGESPLANRMEVKA